MFAATLLLGALATSCTTPPPEAPKVPEKPKMRAALKLPAWSVPIPRVPTEFLGNAAGTNVYTVGDERWTVTSEGRWSRTFDVLGERLLGVTSSLQPDVPVIGWNTGRGFAFTDVLSEPKFVVESEGVLSRVRPGPGSMFVIGLWSAAAFDLAHGVERQGFFPAFPIRDAVFVDDKRGAVAAAVGGIATTVDGGRTWRPLAFRPTATLPLNLAAFGGDIHVRDGYAAGRSAKIDLTTGKLGDFTPTDTTLGPGEDPLERWIMAHGNPLPAAIQNGIDAEDGSGIVARDGAAHRVDLATGLFTESVSFDDSEGECRGAMAGKEAYLLCDRRARRGRDPGGNLYRVITTPALKVEPVSGGDFAGRGLADLLGSPAGGLLIGQACKKESGRWCVRKPDGTFQSIPGDNVPYPATVAPLSNGRVVSIGVRGTAAGPVLEMMASTNREKVVLVESTFDDQVMVKASRPEEGEDKVVRFVVEEQLKEKKEVYFYLYAYEPGKKGFRKTAIEGAEHTTFSDSELVMDLADASKFKVSHDFGATFVDVDMPKGMSWDLRALTRLGVVSPTHARVGWEKLSPPNPTPRKIKADFKLPSNPPPPKKETTFTCKSAATMKSGQEMPKYGADLLTVYGLPKVKPGASRTWIQYTPSPLDVSMLLVIDSDKDVLPPPKQATPATPTSISTWTVRWLDPREPNAKVRTVTGKVPFSSYRARIRGVWAQDGKLFFVIARGAAPVHYLVRTKGSGFETAEVRDTVIPWSSSSVAFSADGNMLAYLNGDGLVVWKSGEAPRPIGAVLSRFGTLIGTPTKEGVPVIADVEGSTYYRLFPLPADKPQEAPHEALVQGAWDGWTRVVSMFGQRGSVMPCDAKPAGATFRSNLYGPELYLRFLVDGGRGNTGASARYEVVSDGHALCLQNVLFQPAENILLTPKPPQKKGNDAFDLVRFSAKGKKGELTHTGHMDKVPLLGMTCEVDKPASVAR